jgi:hypothetical protein
MRLCTPETIRICSGGRRSHRVHVDIRAASTYPHWITLKVTPASWIEVSEVVVVQSGLSIEDLSREPQVVGN